MDQTQLDSSDNTCTSSSSDDSDDTVSCSRKHSRRQEQNRRAAQRCREKKRDVARSVVQDYKYYLSANTTVRHTIKKLEKERQNLMTILSQHSHDPTCQLLVNNVRPSANDKKNLCPRPAALGVQKDKHVFKVPSARNIPLRRTCAQTNPSGKYTKTLHGNHSISPQALGLSGYTCRDTFKKVVPTSTVTRPKVGAAETITRADQIIKELIGAGKSKAEPVTLIPTVLADFTADDLSDEDVSKKTAKTTRAKRSSAKLKKDQNVRSTDKSEPSGNPPDVMVKSRRRARGLPRTTVSSPTEISLDYSVGFSSNIPDSEVWQQLPPCAPSPQQQQQQQHIMHVPVAEHSTLPVPPLPPAIDTGPYSTPTMPMYNGNSHLSSFALSAYRTYNRDSDPQLTQTSWSSTPLHPTSHPECPMTSAPSHGFNIGSSVGCYNTPTTDWLSSDGHPNTIPRGEASQPSIFPPSAWTTQTTSTPVSDNSCVFDLADIINISMNTLPGS